MTIRRRILPLALLLLALAAVLWFAFVRPAADASPLLASGTVEATAADLGFQTGGRIARLAVQEGQAVAAGEAIAWLDAADLEARRAASLAQLDAARAQLAELQHGARPEEVRQAAAAEAAATERLEEAARQLERARALEAGGAVSREALEQAESAHQVARAQQAQAHEQLQLVQRGPRSERLDAQRAAVRQAEAAVAQADAALRHTIIETPFAGIVTVRHRQAGEAVAPGAPVITLLNPQDRWVRIYIREDMVGNVSLGQGASITIDSDPERSYRGRVTFISSEAEFTPRNVQTAEERVKLVYAVKVSIADDAAFALKPGMPADVTLDRAR